VRKGYHLKAVGEDWVAGAPDMETRLKFDILPQPDLTTCGPTCLHALYRYYNDVLPLNTVIDEAPRLAEGGTLAVLLACHALRRGYDATIYTYNIQLFDPTWFRPGAPPLADKLRAQAAVKDWPRIHIITAAYLDFLALGGVVLMEDLTSELIRRFLSRGVPILTGLSATYLYRDPREYGPAAVPDDVRGVPAGHFVVLCGYDPGKRQVLVADPLMPNPLATEHLYELSIERVINAILLGILTFDDNLLVISPRGTVQRSGRAHRHRRQ
jgi:hypothetical protein